MLFNVILHCGSYGQHIVILFNISPFAAVSGGAGGKGTWGAIGEFFDDNDLKVKDHHDPNYESEEDEDVSTSCPLCR